MLAGCSTSNQKAEETTAAPTQTESAASAESKEEAESTAEEAKRGCFRRVQCKAKTDHRPQGKIGTDPGCHEYFLYHDH